ncbi:uncharacterized protein LOC143448968 isoform X2 [Clavelina lepadiformis]|uniref:uncharacterized protein LOC143448968 isoform X2 n=1 Tax=Clavelina lepadiformis TaxID=159417 RepID=UPI004041BFAC
MQLFLYVLVSIVTVQSSDVCYIYEPLVCNTTQQTTELSVVRFSSWEICKILESSKFSNRGSSAVSKTAILPICQLQDDRKWKLPAFEQSNALQLKVYLTPTIVHSTPSTLNSSNKTPEMCSYSESGSAATYKKIKANNYFTDNYNFEQARNLSTKVVAKSFTARSTVLRNNQALLRLKTKNEGYSTMCLLDFDWPSMCPNGVDKTNSSRENHQFHSEPVCYVMKKSRVSTSSGMCNTTMAPKEIYDRICDNDANAETRISNKSLVLFPFHSQEEKEEEEEMCFLSKSTSLMLSRAGICSLDEGQYISTHNKDDRLHCTRPESNHTIISPFSLYPVFNDNLNIQQCSIN